MWAARPPFSTSHNQRCLMFHMAAYTGSLAAAAVNAQVAAAPDTILRIGGSGGFVPQDSFMLLAAAAVGTGITNPRLTAPILAQFNPLQILPIISADSIANGLLVARFKRRPFQFRALEEITATASNPGAAAAQASIIVQLATSVDPIPGGSQLTVGFSSTTTVTAFGWTQISYALNQALPAGQYAMIASELQSATGIAHRWIFSGQTYWPGMFSTTAFTNQPWAGVEDLEMGLMGTFMNTSLPSCQVFAGAADAAHNGYMRIIKVG